MNSVILLAGGKGSRFGGAIPKQFIEWDGKPMIMHSFERFRQMDLVDEIIVVCESKWYSLFEGEISFASPGASRMESVRNGMRVALGNYLIVHDGARPYFSVESVERCIGMAYENGAAALAVKSTNTLRQKDENGLKWLDRNHVWEMQTPQVVRRDLLEKGYQVVQDATDELSVVEAMGHQPVLCEGTPENIKVTYAPL